MTLERVTALNLPIHSLINKEDLAVDKVVLALALNMDLALEAVTEETIEVVKRAEMEDAMVVRE